MMKQENNNNAPITVLFTHKPTCNGYIFTQPLFYLASSIRKRFQQEAPIDTDLVTATDCQPLKLEILSTHLDDKELNINYILKRFDNEFKFTYKGREFMFKSSSGPGIHPIIYNCNDIDIATSYEMTYEAANFSIFDEFIQASVIFFNKNYNDIKIKKDKIKMFVSSSDGSYFECLGTRNKRHIDTIYLPNLQKKAIMDDIENFLKYETILEYQKFGITHKRVYMLEGKPGTGKTSLVVALASHFGYNIAGVSFTPKMTDIALLRGLLSLKDDNDNDKKCMVLIEDMDCIFKARKSNDEEKNMLTFSGLLNALDGTATSENQIYFITTNHLNHLDSALIRPGRVDFFMHFDNATKEQIISIYKSFTNADQAQVDKFNDELVYLNIKVTTSLLQQYLLKYIKKPVEAIENLAELKKMFDTCNISREASDTGLYS